MFDVATCTIIQVEAVRYSKKACISHKLIRICKKASALLQKASCSLPGTACSKSCDQVYKPSSVLNSHLSWPVVADRLTPPPWNAQGNAKCSSTVLLRIGFTGPRGLPRAGELLPRLSTLTGQAGGISLLHYPWGRPRRPLAVILALRSSDFPQIPAFARYPRLSGLLTHLYYTGQTFPLSSLNTNAGKANGSSHPKAFVTDRHSTYVDFQTGSLHPKGYLPALDNRL